MKSTVVTEVIESAPVVVPPPTYKLTLNLTQKDAAALRALCARIGGESHNSFRGLFDDIDLQLIKAGVDWMDDAIRDHNEFHSTIYFKSYDKY